jgi:Fe-S oxidoreductase
VRPATRVIAQAATCTSCAACDLVCPSSLSPSRVISELGRRLRQVGAPKTSQLRNVVPLDRSLAIARLGLARYEREREVGSVRSVAR